MGSHYCQVFVYFLSSLEAHLKLEVELVLTCTNLLLTTRMLTKVLCNCGVMQEKEEMP